MRWLAVRATDADRASVWRAVLLWCVVARVCHVAPCRGATEDAGGSRRPNWREELRVDQESSALPNAWSRWEAAARAIEPLTDQESDALHQILSGEPTDMADLQTRVGTIVERRREAIRALHVEAGESVRLPRPFGPAESTDVQPLRLLGRLAAAEALLLWESGRRDQAVTVLVGLLRSTEATLSNNGGLIGFLTSVGVCRLAVDCMLRFARDETMREVDAARLCVALAPLQRRAIEGFKASLRYEYQSVFSTVVARIPETGNLDELLAALATLGNMVGTTDQIPDRFGAMDALLFDQKGTLELYGSVLADYLRSVDSRWKRGGWSERFDPLVAEWRSEFGGVENQLLLHDGGEVPPASVQQVRGSLEKVENPIGKLFIMIFAPPIESLARTAYVAETHVRAAGIILTLRRRIQATGEVPANLAELHGHCPVDADPDLLDPLGAGMFGYDPVRLCIWSVGADGLDDGGRSNGRNDGDSPDLVWSLLSVAATPGG